MAYYPHDFLRIHILVIKKFKVVDNTLATMAGQGKIALTAAVIVKSMLQVPKLSGNLPSIRQIIKDLNCIVIFFPHLIL